MITNSFVFLKNISTTKEESLWARGIYTWEQFRNAPQIRSISSTQKQMYDDALTIAEKHYSVKNHEYFSLNLPRSEYWRLYPMLKEKACFLDIETTGLDPRRHYVTTIAIYDPEKRRTKVFIEGKNLTRENLLQELDNYTMIVTYNGDQFDLPFMQHHFDLNLPHISFDLRWACRKVGLCGGLKHIEKVLEIKREEDVEGIDGRHAIRLWNRWIRDNDKAALDQLILYNSEDVIHLKEISDIVYQRLQKASLGRFLGKPKKEGEF